MIKQTYEIWTAELISRDTTVPSQSPGSRQQFPRGTCNTPPDHRKRMGSYSTGLPVEGTLIMCKREGRITSSDVYSTVRGEELGPRPYSMFNTHGPRKPQAQTTSRKLKEHYPSPTPLFQTRAFTRPTRS